ncbi:class I SAM-dependent methyltransferase [Nocardioides panacisoli]|uniref:class I SAM-dependent methyltransferase n=1 Tax=Nocardioides panacisoli TaxID=627624 RepID=UPI001C62A812|nr:class I SAM-dependent methyltransferase [Nocardioides panacisoli]QYJ05443.1 class I SAM-dependent methyltransferase [Nocardioides panacisoli]
MNRLETMAVNSPPRRALQRYVETPILRRLGGRAAGAHALEIGCGSGYGSKLILDQFGAASLDAIDLDPAMVERARRRLHRYGDRSRVEQGSVTDLVTVAGSTEPVYDAVFDFAIIHHIDDWRAALHEVWRVLKPGGRLYFVEVTATALARPSYRRLFDHPEHDRFSAGEFLAGLNSAGLDVAERWTTIVGGDYLLGVAHR